MKKIKSPFHGFRFPAAVISCAVRWYHRFNLSLRDVEELLLERGVNVSYESIRNWCDRFGAQFARCAKAVRAKPGSTWHLDEVLLNWLLVSRLCGRQDVSESWEPAKQDR
jgi:putative transposase